MSVPIEVLPYRRGHLVVKEADPSVLPVCSRPTVPGVISERACAFYGARWMLASIPDVIHLIHGPAGCAYYGRTVRRKSYRIFSTQLVERDIIFGAGDKLYDSIVEAVTRNPNARAVLVYATCVAGVIGEDIPAVCKRATKDTGLPVVPVDCPGFCGSQAEGHDIAAGVLFKHFIGIGKAEQPIDNGVNIVGEFDVQGDLDEIEGLLKQLGLKVICAFSGRASVAAMANAHRARLNIVHCRRTGQALAEGMQKRFGIPYLKVSFFGLEETASALRSIGQFFGVAGAEDIIEPSIQEARKAAAPFLSSLAGKRVALFFGASRMGSMAKAFKELGMEVVMAGSQFGCREDYQEAGAKVPDGAVLIDDAHEKELEEFLVKRQPHLLVGGTKEKYLSHKLGVPFLVFPQEMSPFAGFRGFVNLAREAAGLISAPVWRLARRRGEVDKVKVAVASRNGLTVDQHFGRAEQFMIFEICGENINLLEIRRPSLVSENSCSQPKGKDGLQHRLDLLSDCQGVICVRAGRCVRERAEEAGLMVFESEGPLFQALEQCSLVLQSGEER
ncbi:nitrogenase component 1 [Calderihabitans maritimus]|uniref:Nitrogenase molybdenum-iron protein subunit alpha n=1 Tax=Calderihabitans maritimus TaxID=1246530 RepID=A0A1Z5HWI0_9FIRM|nr:nitrogenase component 1 [Calderihabitans maritimus]GAW93889.1 nitrogenase molybdenum-iron protein subunit alpha [Calderihabitans maritimus]